MLILICVALALVVTRLTGGRLSRLASIPWRRTWLVLVALGVQVVIVEVPGLPETPADVVHVGTYVLAAAFVVSNRRVRGLWLLALGAASNGVTIALNGGTLPSTASARALAGIGRSSGFTNSGVVAHPVLGWLGDVFAVPGPFPLGNVFSVGDVLIVAGAVWTIHATAHSTASASAPPVSVLGEEAA